MKGFTASGHQEQQLSVVLGAASSDGCAPVPWCRQGAESRLLIWAMPTSSAGEGRSAEVKEELASSS